MAALRERFRRRRRRSSGHEEVLQLAARGLVQSYDKLRQRGFILTEVSDRLKMKRKEILMPLNRLSAGQEVLFDLVSRSSGLCAINVRMEAEEEDGEMEDLEKTSSRSAQWSIANTGYDVNLFVCEVPEEFICSVCCGVLCQPLQTPCEHIFCGACARAAISRRGLCPVDRRPVTEAQLRPLHRILQSLHAGLRMRCRFSAAGCLEVLRVEEVEEHSRTCSFRVKETDA